jgi:hypothetical protein
VLLKHFLSEELQEMTAGDVIEENRLLSLIEVPLARE